MFGWLLSMDIVGISIIICVIAVMALTGFLLILAGILKIINWYFYRR